MLPWSIFLLASFSTKTREMIVAVTFVHAMERRSDGYTYAGQTQQTIVDALVEGPAMSETGDTRPIARTERSNSTFLS